MNLLTYIIHLASSGAVAYYSASQIRDSKTRPNVLRGLYLSESGSVGFLSALNQRAIDEGDIWLAERLKKHTTDEMKHGKIFGNALKQINTNIDLNSLLEHKNKSNDQKISLFSAYYDGFSKEELAPNFIDWNIFMASTYIMEFDASKDFKRMANVLPENEPITRNLKIGMLSIAEDEKDHAAYLYEAMMRRMSSKDVEKLIDEWRTRKITAIFKVIKSVIEDKN